MKKTITILLILFSLGVYAQPELILASQAQSGDLCLNEFTGPGPAYGPAPDCVDTNSLALADDGGGAWTVTLESTDVQDGSYAYRFTRNTANGSNCIGFIDLPGLAELSDYDVTVYEKTITGTAFDIGQINGQGWSTTQTVSTSSSWQQRSFLTNTRSGSLGRLRIRGTTSGNPGDVILIDVVFATIVP